ncbi:MAG: xanthine dehydrogenase family protein molybdopterin-binding subunit [Thaumarchaeota archaeon]|nr:xanthine dehydrogenase family protein molybdopterin-binding subunit [Nitrososphaerota archaeon]
MALVLQEVRTNSYPRIDGIDRATGRARYGADWKVPDMLYARIIQSSIPHGIVRSIDKSKATNGIIGIITCLEDETVWTAGEREHPRRVFTDHVRFVGDCIGAVAATSRKAAQQGAESVEVVYDELPSVFDLDQALKPDSPKIWDSGNVIGPLSYGFGNSAESFSKADLVIERDYVTSRVHNAPLEPGVSLAWWDDNVEKLTVVAATQGISSCREGLAADLGLKLENVRVICLYKGGGFGNKNNSMNYDIIAALLARKARRPVIVEYSREQDFTGVHGRWSSKQHLRAAVRGTKVLGVDLKGYCDIGAYTRAIKQSKFLNGAEDYYSCDSWSAEVNGVYTNTPTTAHMRAPTGPQACFASETFMDEIANELGVDPVEFRLKNAIAKFHGTEEFLSNSLKECLEIGAEKFGWRKRWANPGSSRRSNHSEKLIGVGTAMATWHSFVGKGEALIKLKQNGTLEVYVGVVDIGTGAKTTMAAIAADALGVPLESVRLISGDTETCPFSIGESGSRTTSYTGTAVRAAALKIREKIISLASDYFNLGQAEFDVRDGLVCQRHDEKIPVPLYRFLENVGVDELVESQVTEPSLPVGKHRYSFAAHFAEVEVDSETGVIKVTGYLACHESGQIVNRLTAESQVQGAVVMGMGMALSEKVLIDPNYGAMQNPSFLNYRLPNHIMIPKIEVEFVESTDPFGPKSLGEIPIVPVPAAIGNAVFNATGTRLRELPFMPERMLLLMDSSQ